MVSLISTFFSLYTLLLMARILLSWIPEVRSSRFFYFLSRYTDPYLDFFRRFIPPLGMIDWSPIVALFALQLIESAVIYLLYRIFFIF